MPTDQWLILAYIMIISSVILCGILPMIFRLYNARRRFHRYDLERQVIEYSCLHNLTTSESIYNDLQMNISDLPQFMELDFAMFGGKEQSIPYIDDNTSL
ncbi:unnamed protein product [Adineta ricciae]|uniref:Uncharacterized protein n=1 Tax=Adineta ricciae TaxID=249248 RepID=A0A814BT46_ADIRI|nr:unnamed protein product [Adineta ricciae]